MRAVVAVIAVLGGLCWVGAPWVDLLAPVGAALLAVGVAAAGTRLVSKGPVWLRLVAGLGFLALVGSVVQVLRDNLDDTTVYLACGAVAVVVGGIALSRRPPSRGSHTR
ncbi:hypothetical protein [Nocardioides mangrovi]|uniref:Uncharacterized protein n=1 Tax=Nocardioides mangrovi TaxID=2874580 RepID=A0ABS7UC34_9ACTN|nr:hypothetical protein [Nocardioides mangrovi]MBZ5738550.1 hypothetical protein [Nocardioides mangrovi]